MNGSKNKNYSDGFQVIFVESLLKYRTLSEYGYGYTDIPASDSLRTVSLLGDMN